MVKKIYLEKFLPTHYKPKDVPDKIVGEFKEID